MQKSLQFDSAHVAAPRTKDRSRAAYAQSPCRLMRLHSILILFLIAGISGNISTRNHAASATVSSAPAGDGVGSGGACSPSARGAPGTRSTARACHRAAARSTPCVSAPMPKPTAVERYAMVAVAVASLGVQSAG